MALDKTDERILAQLDLDARANSSAIARKTRLHKNVVNYRIKNLEKTGIIRGYYAVIDIFRLGYQSYRFYIKTQYTDPKKEKEIMDWAVASPLTWWAGYIQGRFNIGLLIWAKDQEEASAFWKTLRERFGAYISEINFMAYCRTEQYHLPFTRALMKDEDKHTSIGGKPVVSIDNTDAKLLSLISADARCPLLSLANKLELTPAAVRYRLANLQKKGVLVAYRPDIAMDKLGYTYYKIDFNLKDFAAAETIREFARHNANLYYVDTTIGWADLEINIYVSSTEELYRFLDKVRGRFADKIRDYDFFSYSKVAKISYVPADLKGTAQTPAK